MAASRRFSAMTNLADEGPTVAPEPALAPSLRHVVGLSAAAGCVEVIGYMDCGGIYPGIMTGNTVQLGLTSATAQWTRFDLIAFAVASFFVGGIIASFIRRRLRRPPLELLIMAAVLVVASLVRREIGWRVPIELPLLAIAMAMQGEAIAKFGGISIQTIVVTNNMVKFTDALVGRYMTWRSEPGPRVALAEVLLPGLAWLCYSIAAGGAALAATHFAFPLLIPAVILILVSWDLLRLTATARPAIA
jgi:uncharacterized membrane protein YoaK (UPF0700 family)